VCVILFAAIFVFLLVSSLVFESISFRGFYWGPLAGVDSGPLLVSFVCVLLLARLDAYALSALPIGHLYHPGCLPYTHFR